MSAQNFVMPFRPAFDSNGIPIAGAKAYFTYTGTNTPAPIYVLSSLTTPAANPVVANSVGRFAQTFLDSTITYRLRVYGPNAIVGVDTPLEEYDPYSPALQGIKGDTGAPGNVIVSGVVFTTATQFGAVGDGVMLTDGVVSGTSLTSASASFTNADIGKIVSISKAGTSGTSAFTTTIDGVASSTHVTLTAPAPTAIASGATFTYGTDNTAALQSALDYLSTHNGGSLIINEGIYIVNGVLTDTGLSNAQLMFPRRDTVAGHMSFEIVGAYPPGVGPVKGGTIIQSTLTTGSGNLFGGRCSGGVNHVAAHLRNITFRLPQNASISAVDFTEVAYSTLNNVRFDVPNGFGGTSGIGGIALDMLKPTHTTNYAFKGPIDNVAAACKLNNVSIDGYYVGALLGELVSGDLLSIAGCIYPISFMVGIHAFSFGRILITNSPNAVRFEDVGLGGFGLEVNIQTMDIERDTAAGSGPSWVEPYGYDIDDQFNNLRGVIHMRMPGLTAPIKNGGTAIKIVMIGDSLWPFPIYPGFGGESSASSVDEIRSRDGYIPCRVDTVVQPGTSNLAGSHYTINLSGAGGDYRLCGYHDQTDGHVSSGRRYWGTALAGTWHDWWVMSAVGDMGIVRNTGHLISVSGNDDLAGTVSLSAASSITKTFNRAYATAPAVSVTPQFDIGAGVYYWIVPSTTGFTLHISATVTGAFAYHVIGNGG